MRKDTRNGFLMVLVFKGWPALPCNSFFRNLQSVLVQVMI